MHCSGLTWFLSWTIKNQRNNNNKFSLEITISSVIILDEPTAQSCSCSLLVTKLPKVVIVILNKCHDDGTVQSIEWDRLTEKKTLIGPI